MTLPQIVVPMAGQGQRFVDAKYVLPKPMLPVGGVPMVIRAIRDLPRASRVILLARAEHIAKHRIDQVVRSYLPHAIIVPVEELTEGQACTVALAAPHLDPDAPVIVAACDNTHVYQAETLGARMNDPAIAALVWTYRGEPRVLIRPSAHGWCEVDGDRVLRVSCKIPISSKPLEDHAASGFFAFQSAGVMLEAIERLVRSGTRVNGEFYMDSVPNILIDQGKRVDIFEVEKYIGWGTPSDYEDFLQMHRYCAGL